MDKIRFKVDGITEEELSMLLEHDKEINNKLINKKDIYKYNSIPTYTCSCRYTNINTNTKINLFNTLRSNHYLSIYYILFNRGYIYYSELYELFNVNFKHYFKKLENLDIICRKDINDEIKEYLQLNKNFRPCHIKNVRTYEFTAFGLHFFNDERNFIMSEVCDSTKDYIEQEKNNYIKNKNLKLKQEKEDKEFSQKQKEHIEKIERLKMENNVREW